MNFICKSVSLALIVVVLGSCKSDKPVIKLKVITGCAINKEKCSAEVDSGMVEFEVLPHNANPLEPMQIVLGVSNLKVE